MMIKRAPIFILALLSGADILTLCTEAYTETIENDKGRIQSPNFGNEYGRKADHTWRFNMREGKVLKLKLAYLKISYFDEFSDIQCGDAYRVLIKSVTVDCRKRILGGGAGGRGDRPIYYNFYSTPSCSRMDCNYDCSRHRINRGFVEVRYLGSEGEPYGEMPSSAIYGFKMQYKYLDCPSDETNSNVEADTTMTSTTTTAPTSSTIKTTLKPTTATTSTATTAPTSSTIKTTLKPTTTTTSTTTTAPTSSTIKTTLKPTTTTTSTTTMAPTSSTIKTTLKPTATTTATTTMALKIISTTTTTTPPHQRPGKSSPSTETTTPHQSDIDVKSAIDQNVALLCGSIIGGISLVILLVTAVICIVRHNRQKRETEETAPENGDTEMMDNVLYGTSGDSDGDRGDASVNTADVYTVVDKRAKSRKNEVDGKETMYTQVVKAKNTKQRDQ